METGVPLVEVVRDGVVESVHLGHVVLATPEGTVLRALGAPALPTYVRSAAKPFQVMATVELVEASGLMLDDAAIAIAGASHAGSDEHQIEAARLLAEAGLDERSLRCPPALPDDLATLVDSRGRLTRLAHNCSGKHAGFLLAHVRGGGEPGAYLDVAAPIQRLALDRLAQLTRSRPSGPGVDGCGAPAWLVPLAGLATGFAAIMASTDPYAVAVRSAMAACPHLVGGEQTIDTRLMRTDARVLAKRGAEAVIGAAWSGTDGPVGLAVKVSDGGNRARDPVIAVLLRALGANVDERLIAPPVLGGGHQHGSLRVTRAVTDLLA